MLGSPVPTNANQGTGTLDPPFAALERWQKRFLRQDMVFVDRDREFEQLVTELCAYARQGWAQRLEALVALVDLAGTGTLASVDDDVEHAGAGYSVHAQAHEAFRYLIDDRAAAWLVREVLILQHEHPLERRVELARMLAGTRTDVVRLGLLSCFHGGKLELQLAALEALEGWSDPLIDDIFAGILFEQGSQLGRRALGSIERHFAQVELDPGSSAANELARWVVLRLASDSWRGATLAVSLARPLGDDVVVPELIAALDVWQRRAQEGLPVRRIVGDVVEQLRERSGRQIGAHPERWKTWWERTRESEASTLPPEARPAFTKAAFFGLKPMTDRVVFVIDRSGSMEGFARWPAQTTRTKNKTRYAEAIDQMIGFLTELGERTRFNVVLFNDRVATWRSDLYAANASNLRQVRGWLKDHRPDGSTALRPGLLEALEQCDPRAERRAQHLADTIIVLCDGETDSGPSWVVRTLRARSADARAKIHCVQLGSGGDGTLQALSEATGGRFVRVDV